MRKGELSIKNHEDATQNNKNTLISSILPYDVLRLIFEYLNSRDLTNAAMVCRSWLEAANDEKSTRLNPCFISSNEDSDLLNHLIKNLRIEPSFCFCFVSTELEYKDIYCDTFNDIYCDTFNDIYCETYIEDRLFHHLISKRYDTALFFGKTINTTKQMQLIPKVICAFLPRISNVTIASFRLRLCSASNTVYQEMMRTIINHKTSMPNHETSTCFLLFCNDWNSSILEEHWESMQRSIGNEVIVMYFCQSYNEDILRLIQKPYVYISYIKNIMTDQFINAPRCIMITGSIQTWVTVLRKECNTEERIEARLKLFKNEVKLKKHSLGFMFASLHRNIKTNVESTIFKRLFPKIPLVGMNNFFKFKLSNICDKLNNEKNIHKEHESERSEFCYYCTIFLILTYG